MLGIGILRLRNLGRIAKWFEKFLLYIDAL